MKLSTSSRVLAVLLSSGVLLGVGAFACGGGSASTASLAGSTDEGGRGQVAQSAPVAGRATAEDRVTRAFRIGLHRSYALRTTTTTTLGEGQSITIGLRAELHLAYADATDRGERLRFELRGAKLDGGAAGAFDPERARGLETELALPFFVTMRRDGHVVELLVPRAATSIVASLRKHVATLVQYESRREDTWDTSESDTSGVFHARYDVRGAELLRTKDRYERILTPSGLVASSGVVTQAVQGKASFALDDERWPTTLRVDERATTSSNGMNLRDIVSTRVDELRFVSREDDRGALGSAIREGAAYEIVTLESLELFAEQRRLADEGVVKGRSYAALLGGLDTNDEEEAVAVAHAMSAYLRLHPEETPAAAARLRRYDMGAKRLFGALADVGTPEAHEALTDVLRDRKADRGAREDAAMSLSLAENPMRESLHALRAATRDADPDVASASTLAAGNVARKLGESDPDAARDVVTELLQRLEASRDPGEQTLLLRALGNAGDARVVPLAARFLASATSIVRHAACDALTFVRDPSADALLGQTALRDEDADVRVGAIRVSGMRAFDAYASVLQEVVTRDPMTSPRLAAVERLGRAMPDARAVALLRIVAERDSDEDARAAASAILGAFAATKP
jgi:HEAT repeat protein